MIQTTIQDIINKNELVLLDFYKDGCPPCKALETSLNSLKEQRPDIQVLKIKYCEENSEAFKENGVRSAPTLVYIKNKTVLDKTVGMKSTQEIISIFDK